MHNQLIYDGDCSFCSRCARWVGRNTKEDVEVIAFQAMSRQQLDDLQLTEDDVRRYAWWFDGTGTRHRGYRAVARASASTGVLGKLVGKAMATPPLRPVASVVYSLVSRYRHLMPGASPARASETRR